MKPPLQISQSKETVILSFDYSIQEKQYTDESELNTWHFDYVFDRYVKGVNFLTALIEVQGMRIPCGLEFIKKDVLVTDTVTGKKTQKSSKTKNELFREMLQECSGKIHFDYVLADSWFSSVENMICCKDTLKNNRKVALSLEYKQNGTYLNIKTLQLGQQTVEVWFKKLDFPLLLTKHVFKNENDTVGELYLACSDLSLSYDLITTIYKKTEGTRAIP
ncbi:hypothetical protein [Flavicella sp.]|uniref:hypothetical protein n=1 Tax=Flavicella sp. TaxID=2957742 RepID=UPI0030182EEE